MKENFHRKVLKNGFTVLFEKRDVPVVSVAFAVRHGGVHEAESEKGLSHFIEHMLYKGTSKRSAKQIASEIELSGGELNGFTSETATAFWCKLPSGNLDVGLNVLSDMVKNPLFDEKELEKERKVIFEEIKLYRDNPRMHVFDEMHKLMFEKPFGIPLIGTTEHLNNFSRETLVEKFREVYNPSNMILLVVGNADFDELVKFAEGNFSEGGKVSESIRVVGKNDEKIEERNDIDQANLVFSYHVPKRNSEKCFAGALLNVLMAGGMSSRLFSEIREKRNLAYSVKGGEEINKDFAFNFIYVGTTKDSVDEVKKLIIEEFEKVSESLSEEELSGIRNQVIGNYRIGMEDSFHQLTGLLSAELNSRAEEFYEFEEKVNAVKLEDVKEIATKAAKEFSFYALVPKG